MFGLPFVQAAYGQTLFDTLAEKIYSTVQTYTQYQYYLDYLDVRPLPCGVKGRPISGGTEAKGLPVPEGTRPVSG